MAKFQWPAHHVKHARMRDQLWNGHLKRWAWTLKKTGRESIVFFHRSNTAENLPGMWMFFDSLGSSEYGLTTYHFLGWDFRENVSRTFVAWKSRLLLRNMEASLTSWGVQVSAVPATPSRFVHHVVRFASCLGWYRWWFRNPKQPPDMHKNPVNNDRFSISTGVGFLPSTVLLILLLMLMSLENSKIHQNRPGMFFFKARTKIRWNDVKTFFTGKLHHPKVYPWKVS